MELCAVGQGHNYKVISIFKNDFWKVPFKKIKYKPLKNHGCKTPLNHVKNKEKIILV